MKGLPDVSVILAVYNAMPYLTKCLNSLVGQSIGLDRLEIVAVDDGSTDASGKQLDRFRRRHPGTFKVIRQANSGGPAAPSNRGLERATGRYVFFIGADDYLGPEALERLVSAADEHGADVVLGKMVGVNGRWVPKDIFASSQVDVDLFNSSLPFALSNTKLFRRDLIEKYGLRYPEDLPVGSDQPFTLEACVSAERISVLADYDYYYAVRRRNDSNITYRSSHEERLRCTEEIMKFTAGLIEPGPQRDAINHRHFASELAKLLGAEFLDLHRAMQERICARVGRLVEQHYTDAIAGKLDVSRRLRLTLAHRGYLDELLAVIRQDVGPDHPPILVEDDRLYLGYHCFRDTRVSLPDSLFHITDCPAESIAMRIEVTAVAWGAGDDGARVLTVTAHSPVGLTAFGPAAVRMTAERVSGQVTLEAVPGGSGSVVRARFPLDQLLAESQPLGERREIRLQLDVDAATCDVPLRMQSGLRMPKQLGRRGHRPYRISPTRNRNGHLAIDIVPVTARRVIDRVRRLLRQGRK